MTNLFEAGTPDSDLTAPIAGMKKPLPSHQQALRNVAPPWTGDPYAGPPVKYANGMVGRDTDQGVLCLEPPVQWPKAGPGVPKRPKKGDIVPPQLVNFGMTGETEAEDTIDVPGVGVKAVAIDGVKVKKKTAKRRRKKPKRKLAPAPDVDKTESDALG